MAEQGKGSGLFGGVGASRFSGRDPFFPSDAEFLIEVAEVTCYSSQNPQKKGNNFFKIRGRAIAVAFNPKVYDPETYNKIGSTEGEQMLVAGQYATHLISLIHAGPAEGDIKNFATAIYRTKARDAGLDPDEVVQPDSFGDAEIDPLYAPDQPCAGIILGLRTTNKITKAGGDFTQHYWEEASTFKFAFPEQGRVPVATKIAAAAE